MCIDGHARDSFTITIASTTVKNSGIAYFLELYRYIRADNEATRQTGWLTISMTGGSERRLPRGDVVVACCLFLRTRFIKIPVWRVQHTRTPPRCSWIINGRVFTFSIGRDLLDRSWSRSTTVVVVIIMYDIVVIGTVLEPVCASNGAAVNTCIGYDIRPDRGWVGFKSWLDDSGHQRMDDTGVNSRYGLLPVRHLWPRITAVQSEST